MELSFTIPITSTTNMTDLQQLIDLAAQIAPKTGKGSANGHTPLIVDAPSAPNEISLAEPEAVSLDDPAPATVDVPLAAAAAPAATTETPPPAKTRGRPKGWKSPATLAKEAADASANATATQEANTARASAPLGAAQPSNVTAQTQNPAMPTIAVDNQAGYAALKELYAAAYAHDRTGTERIMRAATWPDGTAKPGPWYVLNLVKPEFYDRLCSELAALLPVG